MPSGKTGWMTDGHSDESVYHRNASFRSHRAEYQLTSTPLYANYTNWQAGVEQMPSCAAGRHDNLLTTRVAGRQ